MTKKKREREKDYYGGCLLVVELADRLEEGVELALGRVLEYHVDARVVVEVAVEAQYVRVAEMRLDFDLAPQLVLAAGLLHLMLEYDLERHDVLAASLARQIHVAELALAQRLADLEVVQAPLLSSKHEKNNITC